MVHHNYLDQEEGPNLLDMTQVQVQEEIYVQNQHQYVDQLINMN